MIRKDSRSDLKIGLPFLDSDNIPSYPAYSFKIEIFTAETNKKVASAIYNSTTFSYTFNGCFFKEIQYTNIVGDKPILVIPLNSPKFSPGRLKCIIYIHMTDEEFSDNVQTTVKELATNIVII